MDLSTTRSDNYLLSIKEADQTRLQDQQKLLVKHVYEGRLIFDKTLMLRSDAAILDCGTGSGAWLSDLAKSVPQTAQLYGIDPYLGFLPKYPPPNMHFYPFSVTRLPGPWTGKFHVVHQRLLLSALRLVDWPIAALEMYRVLAPGGLVQLVEVSKWDADTKLQKRFYSTVDALYRCTGHSVHCAKYLASYLEAAGFQSIAVNQHSVPRGAWAGEDGLIAKQALGGALRAHKKAIMDQGGLGFARSDEEYDALMDAIEKEWDEKTGSHYTFVLVTGRKPL